MFSARDAVAVEGFCAVCKKMVKVEVWHHTGTGKLEVGAACHGEKEVQTIPLYQKDLMISFFLDSERKRKAAATRKRHARSGRGRRAARRNGWKI